MNGPDNKPNNGSSKKLNNGLNNEAKVALEHELASGLTSVGNGVSSREVENTDCRKIIKDDVKTEPYKKKGMFSRKPAKKWDEAFPVGNGTMGVLAMGNPLDETLVFNHERLFLPLPENENSDIPDMSDLLPELRKKLKEGRYAEATDFFLENMYSRGFPYELIWTDPFHPAFDLVVRMEKDGDVYGYRRWIDFETGETGVEWMDNRGKFSRKLFVSRDCNVVILSLNAPSKGKLDCELILSEHPGGKLIKSVEARVLEKEPVSGQGPADMWMTFRALYEVGNGGYEGIVRVRTSGGMVLKADDSLPGGMSKRDRYIPSGILYNQESQKENNKVENHDTPGLMEPVATCGIKLQGCDEALIMVRIIPFGCGGIQAAMNELAGLPANYQILLEKHAEIHGELFNRVRLDLAPSCEPQTPHQYPDSLKSCDEANGASYPAFGGLSNEEYMEFAKNDVFLAKFVEKMFDFGRYLLISSSGQLPPNLQGVWNGTWEPPWSSDYTLDENLQMMMWQVLPGNLPELAHSYFRLIESFMDDWRTNARLFYGCRGLLSSLRSSTNGLHKHFNRDYPMMFWTAGAGWLGQMFYDYWQFTGDSGFLRERTVPYLKEVALFYEDFLVEGPDGKFEFIPSYSPENTPSNSDSPAAVNATMDIAVAKEVLANLVNACEFLGIEEHNVAKWKAMLEKMPDYMINGDGALKEWSWPGLEDNYHHRHSSHLYPVFPGFEVTRDETPALYDACLKAAELRLTDGIEAITGWGLAHLANISARLKNADLAYRALCRIMKLFLLPNLFTCHNEGELFQMDANLGFSSAVIEMLVFSKPGRIELLPALPAQLPKGSVTGILCRGGIRIHSLEWNMEEKRVAVFLESCTAQRVTIKYPGRIKSYLLQEEMDGKESLYGKKSLDGGENRNSRVGYDISPGSKAPANSGIGKSGRGTCPDVNFNMDANFSISEEGSDNGGSGDNTTGGSSESGRGGPVGLPEINVFLGKGVRTGLLVILA